MLKKIVIGALLALLGCAFAELGGQAGWFGFFEGFYTDAWHCLTGRRYVPEHVVLAVADDATLAGLKDEPLYFWSPHYARAIAVAKRAGARAVGLDYLFSIGIESWFAKLNLPETSLSRTYDAPFRGELAQGGVVLGAFLAPEGDGHVLQLPIPEFFYALPRGPLDVGLLNLITDPDGVVRGFSPALSGGQPKDSGFTFAYQLAREYSREAGDGLAFAESMGDPAAFDKARIGYAGPPGTFTRISLSRFLAEGAQNDPEVAAVKGKVVIIALEHTGLQDIHFTPYARSLPGLPGKMMSGPEVQANIIETVLSGLSPRPLSFPARLALAGLVLGAGAAAFLSLPPWAGAGAAVLLGAAWAGLSYRLFASWLVLPVAGTQMALLGCFLGTLGVRLTGEERKRAQLKQIFGRYVSKEVVKVLLASGKAPDLGGETDRVTVLFMDIRNFTTLSESLGPHQVVEILNAFFSKACEPILTQGGTLDKFIGDAIMAIFGAPVAYPDHERRALRAALAMVQKAQEFRGWMAEHYGGLGLPEFDIGIGVHTGMAVIGNIGTAERTEFTAIGNTVNTASRIEGLTKTLGWRIVASKETFVGAGPGVKTGGHQTTQVKGRREPVEVYEVLGFDEA
jgi:adenylate cyclase